MNIDEIIFDSRFFAIFADYTFNMKKKYTEQEERLARFAKAMGHPARIAILKFLTAQHSCFFGDIHEVLPISKATVSQHLAELKDAGLIQGEIFPPKVKYCINSENFEIAKTMLDEFMSSCGSSK
jgi:DNA-binding HxlR family transcriptional regulator